MINKVIHYCWFGGQPLDSRGKKCLESWKKYFPNYEIIQWNESNFDVSRLDFMSQAYKDKKWAFVSDVARLLIVYENGGLYFDTDVEVIQSYEDILNDDTEAFFGLECDGHVSSGLGFGAVKGHPILKKLIREYETLDYSQYKDRLGDVACPVLTTNLLIREGFIQENKKQKIGNITFYPSIYFAPIDYRTGKMRQSDLTHSIHWYNASWKNDNERKEQENLRKIIAICGTNKGEKIYGVIHCIKEEGFWKYLLKRFNKYVLKGKNNV